MSGFVRVSRSELQADKNEPITGIPTFDQLFKPDQGTITAFYEDANSTVHETILQVVLSQSYSNKNRNTFACALDTSKLNTFEPISNKSESISNKSESISDQNQPANIINQPMIAWRYKQLKNHDTEFNWDLCTKQQIKSESIIKLDELIPKLKSEKECNFICFSLFSPLFTFNDCKSLQIKLIKIRKYARLGRHRLFISIPGFLHDESFIPFLDNVVQIRTELTLPWEYSRYACILEIIKLTTVGRLRVNNLESLKYGMRISTKGIYVETVDVPPEESPNNSNNGCSPSF